MAGKYDHVIKSLERLPDVLPHQAKVQEEKDRVRADNLTPEDLAKSYAKARKGSLTGDGLDLIIEELEDIIVLLGKEGVEEILSRVNLKITALEQLMEESLDREDVGWGLYGVNPRAIRLPDGGLITVRPEPTAKVLDKEAFRLWCIENGLETSLQLWPSTANALAKERLLAGEPDPDGVQTFSRMKVVFIKG